MKWELDFEGGQVGRGFWREKLDWGVVRLVGYDLIQTGVAFWPFFRLKSMNWNIRRYSWPVRHVSVVHLSIAVWSVGNIVQN